MDNELQNFIPNLLKSILAMIWSVGKEVGTYEQITREWLYWYDANGERFLTPEE